MSTIVMAERKDSIYCPSCSVSLNVPQQYSGRIQCPKCELEFERNIDRIGNTVKASVSHEIRAGVTAIDPRTPRSNSDILFGFGLLILYWGFLFSVAILQVIVLQKEIIEHPNDDQDDSVEVAPVCDFSDDSFDAEECELSRLKDQRNLALLGTIGPGFNLFAFFFIQKYFTFKNTSGDTLKQLRLYTYTLITFKSLEFLMMILLNQIAINYLINIFFVLSLSSLVKYFVFKIIFSKKDIF